MLRLIRHPRAPSLYHLLKVSISLRKRFLHVNGNTQTFLHSLTVLSLTAASVHPYVAACALLMACDDEVKYSLHSGVRITTTIVMNAYNGHSSHLAELFGLFPPTISFTTDVNNALEHHQA